MFFTNSVVEMTKKLFSTLFFSAIVIPSQCFAHGGRTDSNGGHWDTSTNTYHYHSGPKAVAETQPQISPASKPEKNGNNAMLLIGGGLLVGFGFNKLTSKSS